MSAPALDVSARRSVGRRRSPIRRLGAESSCAASDLSSPASDLLAPALDAPPSAAAAAAAEKTE
jgi:hypothetical protein